MKRRLFFSGAFFSLLFLLSCVGPSQRSAKYRSLEVRDTPYKARNNPGSLRRRVLVLPFVSASERTSQAMLKRARRLVLKKMHQSRQFVLVDPSHFPGDPKAYLNAQGDYNMKKVAKLAGQIGVAAVVEGKLMEMRARRIGDEVGVFRKVKAKVNVEVRLRVVSSRSGQIALDEIRRAAIESETTRVATYSYSDKFLENDPKLAQLALSKAFSGTIPLLFRAIEKMSWEGRVAMIKGERIFLNAGRMSGLQVGDILKVTEDGHEVYDPEKGSYIGRAPGRLKGTIEVVSYFGKDGTIAVIHSGAGFKENDLVELY